MSDRREFLRGLAGAAAGIVFAACGRADAAALQSAGTPKRREISVGGRRVKTVDVHCHCHVPEVLDLVKDFSWGEQLRSLFNGSYGKGLRIDNVPDRLRTMDQQGIDVQAVSINPFWYRAERNLAERIITLQNERLAQLCAAHPDRFVGLATVALQFPDLAAKQLEDAVKNLRMRGTDISGNVNGMELSDPKLQPFWAKAEELGTLIFIHPQSFPEGRPRLQGNGALGNTIGNPVETTVALTHLIEEGTLDRFPGLKICGAHGGGFLASNMGRTDRCQVVFPEECKPVKKRPSEYLKQLYFDTIVFTAEGLRHLVAEAGSSQVVVGTDYPYAWNPNPVDHVLSTPGLSDTDRRAILGETAARLLRIGA
jgi:aminocarboxymuconate-semialdehyde decarboxylase